jgi:alpha-tubulin suppressor-like RCC1 family protein
MLKLFSKFRVLLIIFTLLFAAACSSDSSGGGGGNGGNTDPGDNNGGGSEPTHSYEIFAGDDHSFYLVDGVLYATGGNVYGQLSIDMEGVGSAVYGFTPVDTTALDGNISKVIAGSYHTFILADSGKLYATGDNEYGQLGVGFDADMNNVTVDKFTQVDTTTLNGNISKVFAGGAHSFILTDTGKLYAAGTNALGSLGLGNTYDEDTFVEVNTSALDGNISEVILGYAHSFVLTDSGKLYATGDNRNGQLGLGDTTERLSLTLVNTSALDGNISKVFAGGAHSFILTDKGKLYGAGHNQYGMLGVGTEYDTNTFTLVNIAALDGNISKVSAGFWHSMILTDSGKVYSTGSNDEGQLGLGDKNHRYEFTLVDTTAINGKVGAIAVGGWHSMILTDSWSVYGAGSNVTGALGLAEDEDYITSFTQVPMPSI